MKKEDFYGKYLLRNGHDGISVLPKKISEELCKEYGLTLKILCALKSNGLVYENLEDCLEYCTRNKLSIINKITMKKRVYISGPISGHDLEERRQAFKRVQNELEAAGCDTFNPMENGLPAEATTHQHMHRDLSVLTNEQMPFTAIFMMERWLHSAGCKLEFDVATSIGLEVIFEDTLEAVSFK